MNRYLRRIRRPRVGVLAYVGLVVSSLALAILEERRRRQAYGDRLPRQERRRLAREELIATGRRLEAARRGGVWSRLTLWWMQRFGVEAER